MEFKLANVDLEEEADINEGTDELMELVEEEVVIAGTFKDCEDLIDLRLETGAAIDLSYCC